MAALGRILQIAGWLWLIGGFFGSMFGLISINLLPGIILVFVARVIRNKANTREMPDLGEQPSVEQQQQPATRSAETPPQRSPSPSPEPYVLETPSRREPAPEPQPNPKPAPRRRDLLEEVVGLDPERDDDASGETAMTSDQPTDAEQRRPMSSAEMLARAHERWDSKRRNG